ncbi:MAG TPA: hypothetical protein VFY78_08160, partial [Gammaproteobacteria bacterium]|nr:hypothetical protein [Gammaproteobacteria bacterium]
MVYQSLCQIVLIHLSNSFQVIFGPKKIGRQKGRALHFCYFLKFLLHLCRRKSFLNRNEANDGAIAGITS